MTYRPTDQIDYIINTHCYSGFSLNLGPLEKHFDKLSLNADSCQTADSTIAITGIIRSKNNFVIIKYYKIKQHYKMHNFYIICEFSKKCMK